MGVPFDRLVDGGARRFPHGEVIFRQGDDVPGLFLVIGGAVRLSSVTASGREVVVALLGRGDLFGESALLGDRSPVDARSVGGTEVLWLPLATIRSMIEGHPATGEQLLRLVAARLHRTALALEEALAGSLPARVAGRLRELAQDHGVPGPGGIALSVPLTQVELARMVGASREAVNRCMGALAARGLVRSDERGFVISDPDALGREVVAS